jgi:hypothetical protein
MGLFVHLVAISDLGNGPNGHLSGQVKLGADVVIERPLDGELTKGSVFPAPITDIISGFIRPCNCIKQQLGLFFGWDKFDLCY